MASEHSAREGSATTEPYVPCEACELEVPRRLAVVEPQSGGHLCQGCARVLRDMVKNGRPEPTSTEGGEG